MELVTEHLARCVTTLESAVELLGRASPESVEEVPSCLISRLVISK
jgi:hypothetical protein